MSIDPAIKKDTNNTKNQEFFKIKIEKHIITQQYKAIKTKKTILPDIKGKIK